MSTTSGTRINARLDEEHSMKLAFLKRTTRMGVSDIVKKGIDLVYEGAQQKHRDPFAVLSETGFIGSGAGPRDLSERFKEELADSLEAKHGDR
jgi:hypothetical protein